MANALITVVVVNWNGRDHLARCLPCLTAQTFRDFKVLVVDNGSDDGSVEFLRAEHSWVEVIALGKNKGFARGNNVAFEVLDTPFVATLNNDTLPERGWLEALHEAIGVDAALGMAASKILLGAEGRMIDSTGMLLYPDGMTRQRGRGCQDAGQFDEATEILFPSACAALYRREMLEEIGFFDEDFVAYCEDSDLGFRGRLAGYKAVFAPRAVVRHLYSATGGAYSPMKAFYVERNHWFVLVKNLPLSNVLLSPFYLCWRYVVQVFSLVSGQGSVASMAKAGPLWMLPWIALKAHMAALLGIGPMLKKRDRIWASRRMPLREYKILLKKHRITAVQMMLHD